MILLDTSILSLAYRRKYRTNDATPTEVLILRSLIDAHKPIMVPGVVTQEFLTGIREEAQFQKLQKIVMGFPKPSRFRKPNLLSLRRSKF